jgi:hypothetical protein
MTPIPAQVPQGLSVGVPAGIWVKGPGQRLPVHHRRPVAVVVSQAASIADLKQPPRVNQALAARHKGSCGDSPMDWLLSAASVAPGVHLAPGTVTVGCTSQSAGLVLVESAGLAVCRQICDSTEGCLVRARGGEAVKTRAGAACLPSGVASRLCHCMCASTIHGYSLDKAHACAAPVCQLPLPGLTWCTWFLSCGAMNAASTQLVGLVVGRISDPIRRGVKSACRVLMCLLRF